MASPTQRAWIWVDSGSWWWTGRSGALQFMGSERIGHNWATEMNWTELIKSPLPSQVDTVIVSRLPLTFDNEPECCLGIPPLPDSPWLLGKLTPPESQWLTISESSGLQFSEVGIWSNFVVVLQSFSYSQLFVRPQELQYIRLPCPSPSLRACLNSCHWVSDAIRLSHPLLPASPPAFNLSPASGSFPMSWIFPSGGQSIGVSVPASIFPVNIQSWFPLGLTGLISLQSKGHWRVFSNTTVQKHLYFGAQPSLWSNRHIHTWLLEKPLLWLDGPCRQSNVSAF